MSSEARAVKVYLGDGCYAAYEGDSIKLTAEDGIRETDTIYLEPEVLRNFLRFVEELKIAEGGGDR